MSDFSTEEKLMTVGKVHKMLDGLQGKALQNASNRTKLQNKIMGLEGKQELFTLSVARLLNDTHELFGGKEYKKLAKEVFGKNSELHTEAQRLLCLSLGYELSKHFFNSEDIESDDEEWHKMMVEEFDSDFSKAMKSKRFRKVWEKYKNS